MPLRAQAQERHETGRESSFWAEESTKRHSNMPDASGGVPVLELGLKRFRYCFPQNARDNPLATSLSTTARSQRCSIVLPCCIEFIIKQHRMSKVLATSSCREPTMHLKPGSDHARGTYTPPPTTTRTRRGTRQAPESAI
jgi:hypothetical protein